jgi:predicted methyltransferase
VVVDHAAADNAPADVTSTLHRIKKSDVISQVEGAGFKLVAESDALHYATDDGSKRVFENDIRGKTNQFMLKFQKPRR